MDVRQGRLVPNQTVVTRGERIAAVGRDDDVVVPANATRLDGRGRFVMPALWDMHAHVYAVSPLTDLSLYIAYGVTNVRDMQGCPAPGDPFIACYDDKRRWSREADTGTRVGPRIVEASSLAAVTTPVEYAGVGDRFGDVAPPRIADLVVLTRNPLADIRNTQAIELVLFNGRLYDAPAIERIKRQVLSNARSWSVGSKMIWRFLWNPANY